MLNQVRVSAAAEDPPLLSLTGGSTRSVLRAAALSIAAIAEVEDCVNDKTSKLTYAWSELRTAGTFSSTSAVRCTCRLPGRNRSRPRVQC